MTRETKPQPMQDEGSPPNQRLVRHEAARVAVVL